MDIFEGKNKRYCKRLTNKASRRYVCCEVCKLKSRALSHEPSSDCVIARAKGRVRAQASYGNITVLSHLNRSKFKLDFETDCCKLLTKVDLLYPILSKRTRKILTNRTKYVRTQRYILYGKLTSFPGELAPVF